MKVYKDKQFLIFEFDEDDEGRSGKTVKYDFAKKQAIGFKGQPVENIKNQLRGYTIYDIIESCEDNNYGEFLRYIWDQERNISNIGTILERVPKYRRYEQFFSAGLKLSPNICYSYDDIPKSLIKIAKNTGITISNALIKEWRENADRCNLAFSLNYVSLSHKDIIDILSSETYIGNHRYDTYLNMLIRDYGYNTKSLFLYLDKLMTYEALSNQHNTLRELYDYAHMMKTISPKFDKYPRHFLTTHQIAVRNYNRLKEKFSEDLFKQRIRTDYECSFGDYQFIYPKSTQEIKDEAVQQNNCVASYISRVIDGKCHILFLRKKASPNESLVTIEVVNNRIVQYARRFNYSVSKEEKAVIDKWNNKFNHME